MQQGTRADDPSSTMSGDQSLGLRICPTDKFKLQALGFIGQIFRAMAVPLRALAFGGGACYERGFIFPNRGPEGARSARRPLRYNEFSVWMWQL